MALFVPKLATNFDTPSCRGAYIILRVYDASTKFGDYQETGNHNLPLKTHWESRFLHSMASPSSSDDSVSVDSIRLPVASLIRTHVRSSNIYKRV